MRRYLIILAGLLSLFSPAAQAASSTVSALTAASPFGGTELLYIVQGGADRKGTPAQFATYIYGLASGDCTISGVGAVVCTKTNGVAFGNLATVTGGAGIATWLATPSSANLAAALTDETGSGVAVFGTAPTISSPTINTAATLGFITGSTQCLHVNTSGVLSGTGSDCGAGGGAVSSVTGGIGVTVSPTTGAVVVSSSVTQRNNTGTTDTLLSTDSGTVVTESNASPVTVGIAVASTAGFTSGNYWTVKNKGAGLVTISPTTSQIDGAASLTVKQNQSVDFYSDGTNYWTLPGRPTNVAATDLVGIGTNVPAALNTTLSAAGGLTSTIASGTATLGTSAIASGACATVVTVGATNVATTDVVSFSYNSDPTAVTGYGASATGAVLSIYPYPSANNVNVKVCNSSSGSITPGAMTLNWRVFR